MKRIVSVFAILVVAISFCNSFAQSIEGSWATTKKGHGTPCPLQVVYVNLLFHFFD